MERIKRQESQFFDIMRLDIEPEGKIKSFAEKEKLIAKIQREFLLRIEVT